MHENLNLYQVHMHTYTHMCAEDMHVHTLAHMPGFRDPVWNRKSYVNSQSYS